MIDFNMPSEKYHSDPCEVASLSASIAGILYGKSPLHAWYAHPKLNPDFRHDDERKFDVGTCAHKLLLEGDTSTIAEIEFDDWRTKASKEAMEEALAAGRIPILKKKMNQVRKMADAAHGFIEKTELAGIFGRGRPEVTLTQEQNGTYYRSRIDWLTNDNKIILDLKTTDGPAKPESFIRGPLRGLHYDMKAEFYKWMVACEHDTAPAFYWFVQETEAPYCCSLVGMAPSMIELGARKMAIADALWKKCMTERKWPAYGLEIAYAESEPWQENTLLERELEGVAI